MSDIFGGPVVYDEFGNLPEASTGPPTPQASTLPAAEQSANKCVSSVSCDAFGNEITSDGFFDEEGKWNDMTNFEPDAQILNVVNKAITESVSVLKEGRAAVSSNEDFYSEEDAKKLAKFDIKEWLDKKQLN